MNEANIRSAVTAVLAALVPVFVALPYPWAHIVAASLGGGVFGGHSVPVTIALVNRHAETSKPTAP